MSRLRLLGSSELPRNIGRAWLADAILEELKHLPTPKWTHYKRISVRKHIECFAVLIDCCNQWLHLVHYALSSTVRCVELLGGAGIIESAYTRSQVSVVTRK